MTGRYRFAAATVLVVLGLSGCGSDRVAVYPVRGQVLLDGKPADHAYVVFHPQGGSEEIQKLRPYGRANAEGYFELTTFERRDGAPAGQYKVTVICPGPAPGMDPKNPDPELATTGPDRLQGRYADPQKSTISVTVTSGTNELEPFRVP